MPSFGLSSVMPSRSEELPYEYTVDPSGAPAVLMPVGPPQCGIDGLTLPTSAGDNSTRPRSLLLHTFGSVSPAACMASHELYTRVPGCDAPPTCTGVPGGCE